MIIKQIKLTNFRNFKGTHTFEFDKLNLIMGPVGAGKSTLGRIAIFFALFGDAEVPVGSLPTRGKEKTCAVELLIAKNEHIISIKREYPTKITILVNNVEQLENATTPDKEKWIAERFGDLNYFRRFRMIDMKQGVNLLDEGPAVLRKTLISFHENALNNIKSRLQERKSLYDKYNKDKLLVFKHYPSDRRLKILNECLAYNYNELKNVETQKRSLENITYSSSSGIAVEQNIIADLNKTLREINHGGTCPLCKHTLDFDTKHNLILDTQKQLESAQIKFNEYTNKFKEDKNKVIEVEKELQRLRKIQQKISYYKQRLDARFKQKDYVYTNKDIVLVQSAIKTLDKFYASFILAHVKTLEPIINSIISKIDFRAEFQLDRSGNFSILLHKDDKEFIYKDLSSGQRLLLSIAFQIAMLIEKGDIGFIIADEGFNNLDDVSANMLYEILKDLPFQIISILHRMPNVPDGVKVINVGEINVKQIKESIQQ